MSTTSDHIRRVVGSKLFIGAVNDDWRMFRYVFIIPSPLLIPFLQHYFLYESFGECVN